jgi:Septum formation
MVSMFKRTRDAGGGRPRTVGSTRRVVVGAGLGAIGALVVSYLLTTGARNANNQPPEPAAFDAPLGSCLDWTAHDGADVHIVDCAQPHLFESVGTMTLDTAFGPAAAFPAELAWRAMVQEKCTPLASTFLNDKYDPRGRFTVGALKPSMSGWRNGDRSLRCGLQVVARSGELYRVQGGVRDHDQAYVHPPGSCLGIIGAQVGDPVDCGEPHAVEVVGTVDLATAFPAPEYPDENKQDGAVGAECTKLAEQYSGGPKVVADKKLTVYWDTLRPESWQAGTRRVDCKLGALLPDKSGFAPVTGSVRGEVTIGDKPAPTPSATAVPGAPAKLQPLITSSPPVPEPDPSATEQPGVDSPVPSGEPAPEPAGG